jgi:hypothetical protein
MILDDFKLPDEAIKPLIAELLAYSFAAITNAVLVVTLFNLDTFPLFTAIAGLFFPVMMLAILPGLLVLTMLFKFLFRHVIFKLGPRLEPWSARLGFLRWDRKYFLRSEKRYPSWHTGGGLRHWPATGAILAWDASLLASAIMVDLFAGPQIEYFRFFLELAFLGWVAMITIGRALFHPLLPTKKWEERMR